MATLARWCRWIWRWVADRLTEDCAKYWVGETLLPSTLLPSRPAGITACTVVVREGFLLPPLRQ